MDQQCPICRRQVPPYSWNSPGGALIKCEVCGEYRFSELAARDVYPALPDSYIYSGAIREQYEEGIDLRINNLRDIKDAVVIPTNPLESIVRILLYVIKKTTSAAKGVKFSPRTDYPIAYAQDPSEFSYYLNRATEALGYLEPYPNGEHFRLTMDGWKHVAELPKKESRGNHAFVAMWFDQNLNDVWEKGFKAALRETGYEPVRIDRTEHNEKIDDQIIARIRKSGLVVADFTGQRGGVYFEAGFAMGLGIPVIWTCRVTDIDQLHFDTRQYNHIVWTDASDLRN